MRFEPIPSGGLRVHCPAKLNLFLEVGPPRPDGFHPIDSVFQCVSLEDELLVEPAPDGEIRLEEEGIDDGGENLVRRAADALLGADLPGASVPRGAHLRLRKRVPQGAGLGGGSSDAAGTLLALARMWKLRVEREELAGVAAGLGSDVPFFLWGGTARCRGRGEVVTPWHRVFDAAPPFWYVLVSPGLHCATSEVYRALDRSRGEGSSLTVPSPLDSLSSDQVLGHLARGELFFNRLENVCRRLWPELDGIARRMAEESFLTVRMTGSGSTFYGLSRGEDEAERLAGRLREDLRARAQVVVVRSLPSVPFHPGSVAGDSV